MRDRLVREPGGWLMAAWIGDHILPGLITSAVSGAFIWLSHRRTRQHVSQVTTEQTKTLKETGHG